MEKLQQRNSFEIDSRKTTGGLNPYHADLIKKPRLLQIFSYRLLDPDC